MSGKLLLPGCYLTEGRDEGNALRFTLRLTGGRTIADVRNNQPAIAAALGMDPSQFGFDHFPVGPSGFRDTSKVDMWVVLSSPVTGLVFHEGPRYTYTADRFGLIDMGPWVSGGAFAQYELFKPNGMNSGIVIGSSDAGKSSLINTILVGARSTGGVCVAYFDPKGNSNPDLKRNALVAETDMARFEAFTVACEDLVYWLGRQDELANRSGYRPDGYRPAYVVVIDECHVPFRIKGMGKRWGILATQMRAIGCGLLLATQYAGLEAFGGDDFLRSSLRAGNVILMRTESNTSDNLIAPELPSSLTLPREAGNSYLRNKHSRPFRFRGEWLLRSDEEPPPNFPGHLHGWNSDAAYRKYPDAEPCEIFQRAFRAFLGDGDQEQREAIRVAARQADLNAWLSGKERTATAQTVTTSGLQECEGIADRFAALPGPLAKVIQLHRPAAVDVDQLTDTDRLVLDALHAGHTTSAAIAQHTGLTGVQVSQRCRRLCDRFGLITDAGYGKWSLPGDKAAGQ